MDAMISAPREVLKIKTDESQPAICEEASADIRVPFQMGCHGIGVSRIIGAVADTLADDKGLNWPRVMAPFEVIVIAISGLENAATDVYDTLSKDEHYAGYIGMQSPDLVLDDRGLSFPWKMRDADLVGYPVIVVVGRKWKSDRLCEVQCRRLGIRHEVSVVDLPTFVMSLLEKL
jgi:prolyl-tRNA synthetase